MTAVSNSVVNDALSLLIAEGCTRLSSIALRRFANVNGITDAFELAEAWLEHMAEVAS